MNSVSEGTTVPNEDGLKLLNKEAFECLEFLKSIGLGQLWVSLPGSSVEKKLEELDTKLRSIFNEKAQSTADARSKDPDTIRGLVAIFYKGSVVPREDYSELIRILQIAIMDVIFIVSLQGRGISKMQGIGLIIAIGIIN